MLRILRRGGRSRGKDVTSGETEGEAAATAPDAGRASRVRRLLRRRPVIVATLFLATVISGGGVSFAVSEPATRRQVTIDLAEPNTFVALPPFITDLKPDGGKPRYIKLSISVEIAPEGQERLEAVQTQLRDAIQVRLREYMRSDLKGEAGAQRLRQDLEMIVNNTIAPMTVEEILYQDFIID